MSRLRGPPLAPSLILRADAALPVPAPAGYDPQVAQLQAVHALDRQQGAVHALDRPGASGQEASVNPGVAIQEAILGESKRPWRMLASSGHPGASGLGDLCNSCSFCTFCNFHVRLPRKPSITSLGPS